METGKNVKEESSTIDNLSYYEKSEKNTTWSGLDLKEYYGPKGERKEYDKKIGDPGEFPYTRGIFQNMYRGRIWTRRELCGIGGAKETNERIKYLIRQGQGGPSVILDLPGSMGIDADHPRAAGEVGLIGCNINSIEDMRHLVDGIPQDKVSFSFAVASCTSIAIFGNYLAVADENGIDFSKVKGTMQNDPLHARYNGFEAWNPPDLARKIAADEIEFSTRFVPNWYPANINLYDLREMGLTAAQEVAYGFGIGLVYVDSLLERGLNIDDFAPRLAFYCSSHIDFFEEIAKLRAARRLWAKIMKDRYGAKNPRSAQFRFGIHTAGCSLFPQEPLNNAIRIAYEAMAAVLSGAQSVHCCSYDEPIALPTPKSHKIAMRTQQILAYETGVANVSDPLGGSYYIEELTDRMEEEILKRMDEVESQGGMYSAISSKWLDRQFEKAAVAEQRRIESKEHKVVAVNVMQGERDKETPGGVQHIDPAIEKRIIRTLKKFKKDRPKAELKKSLDDLRRHAEKGEKQNLVPAVITCVKANATLSEIMGIIREAYGYPYDEFGVAKCPV